MKLFFIVNPVAGKGKSQNLIPIIEQACIDNHLEFTIKVSSKKGDATYMAKEAIKNGYEKIIAVGGDGTVNEVLNGIAGSNIALGVIPGGSGNDFIRSITNITDRYKSITNVIYGEIRKVDVGLCNSKYFINVASVGLDAEVVITREKAKKYFSGSLAYIASALYTIFTYKGWNLQIEIDKEIIQSKSLLIAIANGKYYGGGIMPAPEAEIDDGYLDICHIHHMSKLKMLLLFPKYIKGRHSHIKEVTFKKGKSVKITCDRPLTINLDGELMIGYEADFSLIHNGINIIFPKE